MPLQAILFDREKLIAHDNWNEPLARLLLGLYQYQVAVIDINKPMISLEDLGITYAECLMIADCEETVQQAKGWNCAVLGYEPPITVNTNNLSLSEDAGRLSSQEKQSSIRTEAVISQNMPEHRIQSHLDMIVEGFEEIDFYFLERVYQRFHHLPWTVIETGRCYLREITVEDLDVLYELYAPEEITRYMEGLHESREKEEEYTKAYIEHMYRFYGYGLWMVIEKETGRIIGRAGLEHRESEDDWWLEMGYMIGSDYQNQGFATEVCQGILAYAKEALDYEQINCMIHKENEVSIHLAENLGFHWEKSMMLDGKEMQKYVKNLQK